MSGKGGMDVTSVLGMDEETEIDDYEIVGAEFFAQMKEPAFLINRNRVGANSASVKLLPDVDYVKMLVNRSEKKLVLKPCDANDVYGYRWARTKDGKRVACQRTGVAFVLILCEIMGWDPDNRYKILGKKRESNGETILVYDLTVAQCFRRQKPDANGKVVTRSALPAGWDGKFGPALHESYRTLKVDTFEGYTVFTVRGAGE